MNLNKYHGSGRLYTQQEAHKRADRIFRHGYIVMGYRRGVDPATGLPRIEAKQAAFRNEAKRQERESRSRMKSLVRGPRR